MKLSVTASLNTDTDTLREYLFSEEYLADAAASTSAILRAEVEERDGDIVAIRWHAPTRLPKILSRYEGTAPESVNWLERTVWKDDHTATLEVIPDVPKSWHSKYTSSGTLKLVTVPSGVELRQDLEFKMDFGLVGKALEKLLKNEIETLLKQRLEVLRKHF